jgi:hypothetical protein
LRINHEKVQEITEVPAFDIIKKAANQTDDYENNSHVYKCTKIDNHFFLSLPLGPVTNIQKGH